MILLIFALRIIKFFIRRGYYEQSQFVNSSADLKSYRKNVPQKNPITKDEIIFSLKNDRNIFVKDYYSNLVRVSEQTKEVILDRDYKSDFTNIYPVIKVIKNNEEVEKIYFVSKDKNERIKLNSNDYEIFNFPGNELEENKHKYILKIKRSLEGLQNAISDFNNLNYNFVYLKLDYEFEFNTINQSYIEPEKILEVI